MGKIQGKFLKIENFEILLINILTPLLLGLLSSFLSGNIGDKYNMLVSPPFAPPRWMFPVVWTILYLLMGVAAYFVFTSDLKKRKGAFFLYTVQLSINFLWTIFFFGLGLRLFSFIWIILLIAVIIKNIKFFYNIKPISGVLMIPYLLWCVFAAYLNFGFWYLNK